MRRFAEAIAVALCWSAIGQAQIAIPPETPIGRRVIAQATIDPLPGSLVKYAWTASDGVELAAAPGAGESVHVWAVPGKHELTCEISYSITVWVPNPEAPDDPTKAIKRELPLPPYVHGATFVVTGQGPQPPPDPEPGPLNPLAALVPNAQHRALLTEFYSDMADAVLGGAFTSTSHFRAGYRESWKRAQDTGVLPTGLSAIDKPISDRLAAAIGLADVALDDLKKQALAAALAAIAFDFRG